MYLKKITITFLWWIFIQNRSFCIFASVTPFKTFRKPKVVFIINYISVSTRFSCLHVFRCSKRHSRGVLRTSERWWWKVCPVLHLVIFVFPFHWFVATRSSQRRLFSKTFGCLKVLDGMTDAKKPLFHNKYNLWQFV